MSSDTAIKITALSKCYNIYDRPHDRLKQSIYPKLQRIAGLHNKIYYREFWAVRNISFEVKKGETVGIIGQNGSGKSTLLQLICGTLAPTSGLVETTGRVAALLELGSGFNPDFTGRENVYMNGAILGLSKQEIDARFHQIASFADIGDFIDQPVKTYSSGMLVRLAFSVSICIEPDILVIDEALAVGDINFQAKCMTALTRIQEKGTTILFVSHDIGAVKSLCSKGIYLERGNMAAIGNAPDIAELYVRTMREEMNAEHRRFLRISSAVSKEFKDSDRQVDIPACGSIKRSAAFDERVALFRYGSGDAKITLVELLNADDESITLVEFNQEVKIRIYFEAFTGQYISANFNILDDKKNNLTSCGFLHADTPYLRTRSNGRYLAEYLIRLPLKEGNYSIRSHISAPVIPGQTAEFLDVIDDAVVFKMAQWEKARVWSDVFLFPKLKLFQLRDCDETVRQ